MTVHVTKLDSADGVTLRCSCGWSKRLPPRDAWLACDELAREHREDVGVCTGCGGTCRIVDNVTGEVAPEDDYQLAACGTCDGAVCNCPHPFPGGWSWNWRHSIRPDLRLLNPHDYGMFSHRSAATLGLRVGAF